MLFNADAMLALDNRVLQPLIVYRDMCRIARILDLVADRGGLLSLVECVAAKKPDNPRQRQALFFAI